MGDDTKTNDNQTGDDKPDADQTATPPIGTATPDPVVKPADSVPVTESASEPTATSATTDVPAATPTGAMPADEKKKPPEGGDAPDGTPPPVTPAA